MFLSPTSKIDVKHVRSTREKVMLCARKLFVYVVRDTNPHLQRVRSMSRVFRDDIFVTHTLVKGRQKLGTEHFAMPIFSAAIDGF